MSHLKERIDYLKSSKKMANDFLALYKKEQNKAHYVTWEKEVIFFNVKKLKEIIRYINRLLSQKSLKEYVSAMEASERIIQGQKKDSDFPGEVIRKTSEGFGLPFKIVRYSPSYSLVFDLNWLTDGTVKEHIDIAVGSLPIEVLSLNYHNERRKIVSKVLKTYIADHKIYSICHPVLDSALDLSRKDNFLASNILILTGIESLVRHLAAFILAHQYPELSEREIKHIAFQKYNSLETLIRKCEFKDDYLVTLPEANQLCDIIDDRSLDKCKEMFDDHQREARKFRAIIGEFMERMSELKLEKIDSEDSLTEEDSGELKALLEEQMEKMNEINQDVIVDEIHSKKYSISIRVKLHFLARRLKDLRNELVHGKYDVFSTKHHNFISLAALHEVITLLKDYDKIYEHQ